MLQKGLGGRVVSDKCAHSGEAPPPDARVPDVRSHSSDVRERAVGGESVSPDDRLGSVDLGMGPDVPSSARGRLVQFYSAYHPELLRAQDAGLLRSAHGSVFV